MTEIPILLEISMKQSDITKTPPTKFKYFAIADRLSAVKLSNYRHLFDVFKDNGTVLMETYRFKCTKMKIIHKYDIFPNFDFICSPYK